MYKSVALMVAALALAGCATSYQEIGLTGGVVAERMTADTWRIKARTNGLTDPTTMKDYVMLKAAETTQEAGGTHFLIISETDVSRRNTYTSGGSTRTRVVGGEVITTRRQPTTETTIVQPAEDAYIRVLKLAPGETVQGAVSAADVIQYIGSRVKRG